MRTLRVDPHKLGLVDLVCPRFVTGCADAARLDGAQEVAAVEADALGGFGEGEHPSNLRPVRLTPVSAVRRP